MEDDEEGKKHQQQQQQQRRSIYHMETCDPGKPFSVGIFYHENPIGQTASLLMLQIITCGVTSQIAFLLLRPFRQPRIVSDVIGGIIAGHPTFSYFLSRIPFLAHGVFAQISANFDATMYRADVMSPMRTLAAYGIVLKFFLIGVKIDPTTIWKCGRKAFFIGVCGMLLSLLVLWSLLEWIFKAHVRVADDGTPVIDGFGHPSALLDVAGTATIAAPSVIADALTDLRLLNTELGRLAVSASMISELTRWVIFAVRQMVDARKEEKNLLKMIEVQGSPVVVMLVIFALFRMLVQWILRRTPKGSRAAGWHILIVMMAVMGSGILSDAMGLGFIDSPMIMGLLVPEGPPLGTALVERLDVFSTEILLPVLFLGLGWSTKLNEIKHLNIAMTLLMLIMVADIVKVLVTLATALYCKTSLQNAAMLGLMLNFKGLVEIIVYMNLKNIGQLERESFAVFIVSIIMAAAICSLLVSFFYDPLNTSDMVGYRALQYLIAHEKLCVVVAVLNEEPVPIVLNLIEASSIVDGKSAVCIYPLHLVELGARTSSSLIAHRSNKADLGTSHMNCLLNAFTNYEKKKNSGAVSVYPFTAISPYNAMHQDICSIAMEKKVPFVIVPFPRKCAGASSEVDRAARSIVPQVLAQAPCSVGVLVHPTLTGSRPFVLEQFQYSVRVLFWGGNDDREALSYAARLARHCGVWVSVTRFLPLVPVEDDRDLSWDDVIFKEFVRENAENQRVLVEEIAVQDAGETVKVIKLIARDCDLVMVGRRQCAASLMDEALAEWIESPELGVVGDMLASSDFASLSFSILVVRQHV